MSVSEDGDKFLLPRQHRKGVTGGDHMVASMSRFIPLVTQSHYSRPVARMDQWVGTTIAIAKLYGV